MHTNTLAHTHMHTHARAHKYTHMHALTYVDESVGIVQAGKERKKVSFVSLWFHGDQREASSREKVQTCEKYTRRTARADSGGKTVWLYPSQRAQSARGSVRTERVREIEG